MTFYLYFLLVQPQPTPETIIYRTIENAIAAYLLGVVMTLYFLFVSNKVLERWDELNDLMRILNNRDRKYKRLILRLSREKNQIIDDTHDDDEDTET